MLPATIVVQFIKIWNKNLNYIDKAYDIFDDKIQYFFNICYTTVVKQYQFYIIFLSILSGQVKDYFVYNINQNMTFAKIYSKINIKFDIKVNKA